MNILQRLAITLVVGGEVKAPGLEADQVLASGLNIVYMLAAIIAVIVIIIGGILFTTSAGDSGGITKAKNMILYAVIGLIVIISAYAITAFVVGRF
jgi:hypothetical protein